MDLAAARIDVGQRQVEDEDEQGGGPRQRLIHVHPVDDHVVQVGLALAIIGQEKLIRLHIKNPLAPGNLLPRANDQQQAHTQAKCGKGPGMLPSLPDISGKQDASTDHQDDGGRSLKKAIFADIGLKIALINDRQSEPDPNDDHQNDVSQQLRQG